MTGKLRDTGNEGNCQCAAQMGDCVRMVHCLRNLLAHVPQGDKAMVAAAVRTIFAQPHREAAGQQVHEVVKALEGRWPKAAKVLADAEDDILAYMAFPPEHWTRLSSSPGALQLGPIR